jgi:hypothetical protein
LARVPVPRAKLSLLEPLSFPIVYEYIESPAACNVKALDETQRTKGVEPRDGEAY